MDIYWCFSPIESTQPCWYWYGDGYDYIMGMGPTTVPWTAS